jgi:hypothetical protein
MASIKRRRGAKKKRFLSSRFHQAKSVAPISGCTATSANKLKDFSGAQDELGRLLGSNSKRRRRSYGPLSATPKSTGWSAGVSQRQPLSVFWNANAFSILSLRATEKPSLLAGDGFAQHMPVQLDAIGLQSANGESTIISTSAVTSRALLSHLAVNLEHTADP